MKGVQLTKMVQELELNNLTPEIDLSGIVIKTAEINRPALQLTGYLEHFANERVQIIGYVEYTYLMQLNEEERRFKYERFISSKIPCVIFSTMTRPSQDMIDLAVKYNVPTFVTERTTSSFMAEIIRWLGVQLAPCISIHGVLVDVYGEGILITGESGIGKSEAALELIKRGHRLVSDDVVEIRKVSDVTLVGSAPDITRHFIELRGIGIIDVKTLFGVESVKDTQSIDLVIKLEEWDRDKEYDRLGLHEEYTEYLGNKIVCHFTRCAEVRITRKIAFSQRRFLIYISYIRRRYNVRNIFIHRGKIVSFRSFCITEYTRVYEIVACRNKRYNRFICLCLRHNRRRKQKQDRNNSFQNIRKHPCFSFTDILRIIFLIILLFRIFLSLRTTLRLRADHSCGSIHPILHRRGRFSALRASS